MDPQTKPSRFSTIFLLLLLAGLFYLLYQVLGGDWQFWLHWSSASSGGSPLDAVTSGLSSVANSLSHMFAGFGH